MAAAAAIPWPVCPKRKVLEPMVRRRLRFGQIQALLALTPMIVVAVGAFGIGIIFTIIVSFTDTGLFLRFNFIGLRQYEQLWRTPRWIVSVQNIGIFGALVVIIQMTLGYLLAVFIDQKVRAEDTFRTIFLYPFAMSLVVTGLVWQWIFDANVGLTPTIQRLGFESFHFSPLTDQSTAIYGVVIGAVWNGVGVTMAILLSGLRGVDEDIWKATRVDGIPAWRTYVFIALPMIRGSLATAFVLQCTSIVRVYDLVVAMTAGGPGNATQMPATLVIESFGGRQNAGFATAAATMMLMPILAILLVRQTFRWHAARRAGMAP